MSSQNSSKTPAFGNPVIALLLSGILLALVVLIGVIGFQALTAGTSGGPGSEAADGMTVIASQLSKPPKAPQVIGDPNRIKEILQAGKTYRIVLKAGITARVEDKQYTIKTVVNMAYMGEFEVTRKVESNDGKRVVELRTFQTCKTVKLESHVDDLKFDWGVPGELVLASLDMVQPGLGTGLVASKPLLEGILRSGADVAVKQQIQAWSKPDSLSGKSVRITYVDGLGVVELQPVGCVLSESEQNYVANTAVLSDHYLFPNIKVAPNHTWKVQASDLPAVIDPSLRGIPSGEVTVERKEDEISGDQQFARLEIKPSRVTLDASDASAEKVGSIIPQGSFKFNLTKGLVEEAELKGEIEIKRLSKDHLLFETTMRTEPKFQVQYHCKIE